VASSANIAGRELLRGQKRIWLFPAQAARGEHWKPALAVVAATGALVALDPHDTPYFRRTSAFSGFNKTFSGVNTGILEGTVPLVLYVAGRACKSHSTQKTALLAAEGLVDAEIVSEAMKNVDRRLRPSEIPPNGDFGHTWFKAGGGILITRGSFPSGHAIGAFALATVLAERYRQHRWAPFVFYGVAATIAFSRVTLQAHFPSDVFAGAALGYSISHFVVMRGAD
jgi:membrane-associated phospholipid phosphatase